MNKNLSDDFTEMEKKLNMYVEKGRVAGPPEVRAEPILTVKPEKSLIKPLKKMSQFDGYLLAVDCSTRTLKRANNWGVYLMRAAHASVQKRNVDWGFNERICTVVGDARMRRDFLHDFRIEMESQIALSLLTSQAFQEYYAHGRGAGSGDVRSVYLLLDGGGYFGGESKFRIWLYERCEKDEIPLLAISKNSPSLHDEKGRDFIAAAYTLSPYTTWIYHPVRTADKDKSLYGDISLVKLCEDSPHVFRCDVMEYLTNQDIASLLSPLTTVAEDPRCLGYPISLWLAHEFSQPSESMLLSYHDHVENALAQAGLLETLRREELSCSFADKIHGIKHAFEWEWWDNNV